MAPSAAPAPTKVCSSSMWTITSSERRISCITALILSSNCPRYLVPATIRAKSKAIIRLFLRTSGTFPATILWASPSTMAVFPTPASPNRTGLFLVLLLSISVILCISSSLPMTGSSLSSLANWVRSRPKASRAGVFVFLPAAATAGAPVPGIAPPKSSTAFPLALSRSTPILSRTLAATPSFSLISPRRRCSVPI